MSSRRAKRPTSIPVFALAGCLIFGAVVAAQGVEPELFPPAVEPRPATPPPIGLAKREAVAPLAVMDLAMDTAAEELEELARWNTEGRLPLKDGFARHLPEPQVVTFDPVLIVGGLVIDLNSLRDLVGLRSELFRQRVVDRLVRKDLVRRFSRQFPVPTYVVEFLLGRYCATTDETEILEGLKIVQRQLETRTVKAGDHELFKARAKEAGSVKLIDLVSARLDAKTDSYLATLPSLQLKDVRIGGEIVSQHERLLTGGA